MRKDALGRRQFKREFKVKAVKRVLAGEPLGRVARDLEIGPELLWRWRKRVIEQGEDHLYELGRPKRREAPSPKTSSAEEGQARRIAELERIIGKQQAEIRFLDKALRQVEELRQRKNDDGEVASSRS